MRYLVLRFAPVLLCVGILVAGAVVTGWATPADPIKVTFESFVPSTAGTLGPGDRIRTNVETPKVRFKFDPKAKAGKLVVSDTVTEKEVVVGADAATVDVDLPRLSPGLTSLTARLLDITGAAPIEVGTVAFAIEYDTSGPKLIEPIYTLEGSNAAKLTLRFDEPLKTPGNVDIDIKRETALNVFDGPVTFTKPATATGNVATIALGALGQGRYRVEVKTSLQNDLGIAATAQEKEFFVGPGPGPNAPIRVSPSLMTKNASGYLVTRSGSISVTLTATPLPTGDAIPVVNGIRQPKITLPGSASTIITLADQGLNTITFEFIGNSTVPVSFETAVVYFDRSGPVLQNVQLSETPTPTGTTSVALLTFDSDDIDPASVKPKAFTLSRQTNTGAFAETVSPTRVILDGRIVRLEFPMLYAGDYQLAVKGTGPEILLDTAGNPAGNGAEQTRVISILGGRRFGEHVEFPPYTPPKPQIIPPEGFNPGDFVETRVARLYYYRDAHRVAQIINRNIRSYNQAAVTQAERRAENSRDEAQQATDDRRAAERQAVRAAEQAREKENELAAARSALTEARQARSSIAVENANVAELKRRIELAPEAEKKGIQSELQFALQRQAQEGANLARFGGEAGVDAIEKNVAALEQSVASYRQTELIREEQSQVSAAKEDRLRAQQFRDEVSAAETDPDTYVAGNLNSVDPVTQVSISVIGEGLLELRGPIKGINKIRTMINQIDSPVGQIKIGIFTVQINGERGEKMEKCVTEAENHVDLSRFLVNQSLNTLRRCIQAEAAAIAEQCGQEVGHYQVDRDRRYLYSFFGRDFLDELYAIDSEFLKTENTVLSLHAMDTLSLNRALFILALAKNDVRERIIARFLESAKTELPNAEFDFRRASELKPHVTEKKVPVWNRTHLPVANHYKKEDVIYEAVHRNAQQRYHFRNFSSFFDLGFVSPDTMNPMQREFIRLAQIFKARLLAEMEWKQRVLERGLIEDRSNNETLRFELLQPIQREIIELEANIQRDRIRNASDSAATVAFIRQSINTIEQSVLKAQEIASKSKRARNALSLQEFVKKGRVQQDFRNTASRVMSENEEGLLILNSIENSSWATDSTRAAINSIRVAVSEDQTFLQNVMQARTETAINNALSDHAENRLGDHAEGYEKLALDLQSLLLNWQSIASILNSYRIQAENSQCKIAEVTELYYQLRNRLIALESACMVPQIVQQLDGHYNGFVRECSAGARLASVRKLEKDTRVDLDHRKLLNHLIDEQEEKFIELVEGTRSHIAVLDDYLKRLSIAIEDDFKIQFYDPAFVRVRESARARQVVLSQVERTTVLTNNRDFAKVDPQATMEFDLPKRQIAIKEAFDAARALVEDSGALMNDPTFLAAFQMMGGAQTASTMKTLLPTQSSVNEQRDLGYANPLVPSGVPGSALQSLVPEPSIFKLETGTGFQIRPVMQPDGDSVVYDFDYMYTTNIREPVRADEKHIGRVKRHFVHTAVQTGNFEIREVSRYQVALKVARTGQGVPLLQDIPVVGAAFRPAPSDESSIQQNIIFGQTNVYPTLYDLMGLRWAQQVVDLDHSSLLEAEHVIRGRQKSMKNYVFGEAARRVDDFLDVEHKNPPLYRTDLYYPQSLTSPHHPDGYSHPAPFKDPTGNNYERVDRRPTDMQEPPYDRLRHRPATPETIQLQSYEAPVPVPPRPQPTSVLQSGAPVPKVGKQNAVQPKAPSSKFPKMFIRKK